MMFRWCIERESLLPSIKTTGAQRCADPDTPGPPGRPIAAGSGGAFRTIRRLLIGRYRAGAVSVMLHRADKTSSERAETS
ncbi:hypothetical protein CO2235_150437 [Cupriavidus oxalaticus]|uniref:Uncharacterized protein n=1 Tax=Cupriavidus oxalaticus TaxID=96344 RepID=A0A375G207_9BURK|nr:hypothetical protein CO2235_U670025 [Cupriavidus oxalaticus]SPC12782.1 hypothetical protein CO2235_150437 [Cupriavidus oxalaticus]